MTVSAPAANNLPAPARGFDAAMRSVGPSVAPVRAGTYPFDGEDLTTRWHQHDLHQIEYAFEGVVEVDTAAGHYFLPPQQAMWIPAGLVHNTTLRRVKTISVFFDPSIMPNAGGRAQVLAVAPVIREMIRYALRWPIARPASDEVADAFFAVLIGLIGDSLAEEAPFFLPSSTDPLVAAAMTYTSDHLADVRLGELCRAIGTSERTLRRQFAQQTSMSWRGYLLQARLLRAAALLTEPERTVLDIATSVGFESASAFSRAFARYAGETPRDYRHRTSKG
jgi:AraC-like DNA-binding protein